MNAVERNRFGMFDTPVRSSDKELITLTPDEMKGQLAAGAFMMSREKAIEQGFLHPHDEQDTVIAGIGEAV
ncbi:MAG: hypothetical protein IJD16_07855 [Desulfovibrio sp.]|nr:hypothetical protein [Desulfovibrio sp.]